ncbi:MAG TPA: [Fe-Fe] hydrogenase large subunit C-terminal domain-containing protein [Candidatus Hydrogenedentes bacterium]|nr:[Fe-Fe] hydrogenase large subunit C-terminal domain-containing protein [Candidatus Hydrogenedentota bacterium]HPA03761.1 [Fe-Fe] hydrogenase large subunit C-terminal domain-containing protein [Candidatus Hydrogenedentota bacterium]HQE75067.1 [Fe-Fe] hydrogenase large subunit C-terminal domain-containing protein [Candidatus Hydrogenedentota bacterium]HQH69802.1 [Fe-Fe] hydrogenase large subunit C-terminal domain-containing protein [Candidatus Hydrogenedentota bacterium]
MKSAANIPLVTTIKERCRVCFTCVRECPAKAIRIVEGQADVICNRCIGCGNCVRVCSQNAKRVLDSTAEVEALLAGDSKVAALLAPSFPVEFDDCDYERVVGMLRALGFDYVTEVAFGADLVADRYRKLVESTRDKRFVATTCPSIVAYVQRYQPELVKSLAPIVSPMVAMARVLHQRHGQDLKVVFIGPCIAKKGEAASDELPDDVQSVLTFAELQAMLTARNITPESVEPSDFDPPHARYGGLFPVSRGLLQAANISEDLVEGNVAVADGRVDFPEAISEFAAGFFEVRLLETLACKGCIMGPGTTNQDPQYVRRCRVSSYVRRRMQKVVEAQWSAAMQEFSALDLSRTYRPDDQRIAVPSEDQIREIMERMGKFSPGDELNCGACGYETCREHAIAIYKGLAETAMCLPYTIDQLATTIQDLNESNEQLAEARSALVQSEKLASMGQLAAGIAHELNNPLGIVLMYAHILKDEFGQHLQMQEDLKMISEHADRCKKIVAGLLHFARQNKVLLESVDVGEVIERVLRANTVPENVQVRFENETRDPMADIDRDQMTQVLTNLIGNALAAMPDGGVLTVRLTGDEDRITFRIIDTGTGIKKENLSRIFDPFFTTKQLGVGTGLGLAVTYGIVKMHRGDIRVESNPDPAKGPTGTAFTISLPRHGQAGGPETAEMSIGLGEEEELLGA